MSRAPGSPPDLPLEPVQPAWMGLARDDRVKRPWSASDRPGPGGTLLARPRARVLAFIIDVITLSLIGVALSLVLGALHLPGGVVLGTTAPPEPVGDWIARSVLAMAVDVLYFTLLWTGGRRTVGMRLLRMRVVRADGAILSGRAAVLRWLMLSFVWTVLSTAAAVVAPYPVDSLVSIGWLLVLLLSTTRNAEHQGLHDRFAGSLVVSSAA